MLQSVLNDTLKDFDYYYRKLPKYLRESEGFISHFQIWYDILVGKNDAVNNSGIVGTADTLFALLNIFDQKIDDDGNITNHYLDYLNSLPDSENGTKSDILDKLGLLFGVTRNFSITYTHLYDTYTKELTLNNNDFLILIKAQIIKNYCNGSREQMTEYYYSIGLTVILMTSFIPATAFIYLAKYSETSNYAVSDDVEAMFLAGMLTIRNIGINYYHNLLDMQTLLIWKELPPDNDIDTYGWGNNVNTIKDETGGKLVI